MRRMIDNQIVVTRELMTECGQHGGAWITPDEQHPEAGFCVIQDESEMANYVNHVRVEEDEEGVTEEGTWLQAMDKLDEIVAEANQGLMTEADYRAEAQRLTYTGLAPDAPITENENGGKQSVVEGRFDLIPPVAAFELAKVMEHGAEKYAPRNWMKIPVDSHLNHLLMHVFAYLAGDRQEEHLTHALARAAMAVEIEKVGVDG